MLSNGDVQIWAIGMCLSSVSVPTARTRCRA